MTGLGYPGANIYSKEDVIPSSGSYVDAINP